MIQHLRTFIQKLFKQSTPVLGVLCLFIVDANAQQKDTVRGKELSEAVITGEYGENSLSQSTLKVRTIDQKRIEQLGAVNLKDVLSNEINIRIFNDPNLGSSVNIQGISGQGVKLLIDGVPVIGREGGNIDLNQINMNNVERIEIVEGPMSVSYGTDALGGVINIITKKPTQKQQSLQANTFYESTGWYNADAAYSLNQKKFGISTNIGRNFFDGFDLNESNNRFRTWKPREQYFADIQLYWRTKWGNFRLGNNYFSEKVTDRDSGNITPFYAYGLDKYYHTTRYTTNLFFDKQIKEMYSINVVASYNYYNRKFNTMRKDLVSLEEAMTIAPEQHDTNNFHYWMSRGTFSKNKKGATINYQVGYELNHETAHGSKISEQEQSIADYNLFGSVEWKVNNRLVMRPGVRFIYNTRFDAPIIPSLNLKYDLTAHVKIRASYGRGYRAPSLKELYLNFVDPSHNVHGNPNLEAEKSDNVQIHFTYDHTRQNHHFKFEPGFFYNHINNMIDLMMVDVSTVNATYFNVGSFEGQGFILSSTYQTPTYNFQFGYVYSGRKNSFQPDPSFFYTNEYRFNFQTNVPKINTTISLFYKYNGKLQAYQYSYMSNKTELEFINPFHLLDATLSKQLWNKKISVTAGVKNILDVKNVRASMSGGIHQTNSNSASIAMGRNYFVSLRIQLFNSI